VADPKITYESLQSDSDFLSAAYYAMRDLGYNDVDPANPKDILDTFIENKRYFDTNLIYTIAEGNDIIDLPDDSKKMFAYALDKINKMPDFYEEGGTGWASALGDYLGAAVTDPTNIASALAGFFTAGAGSAAIQAGKEAAKQTVANALKGRLRSAISKPMLKSYAAESAVAGTGAAVQEFGLGTGPGIQGVNVDLGLQDDIDYAEGAKRIFLEGTLSPIAGASANLFLGSVKDAVISPALRSSVGKSIADSTAISQTANYLKNNFLPLASLEEVPVRLMERTTSESRPVMELVEKLVQHI
jgi:hypothetical protein